MFTRAEHGLLPEATWSYRDMRRSKAYRSERLDCRRRWRQRVRALIRELHWQNTGGPTTAYECVRVRFTDCGAPKAYFVTARLWRVRGAGSNRARTKLCLCPRLRCNPHIVERRIIWSISREPIHRLLLSSQSICLHCLERRLGIIVICETFFTLRLLVSDSPRRYSLVYTEASACDFQSGENRYLNSKLRIAIAPK